MQRTIDLEIVGPSNPLFEDVSILYDAQQHLVAQNELGEKRFRIPLFEQGGRRLTTINRNAYNAPALTYASVNGGLLVLSLGNQLVAVDTLRAGDGASNRVLWTQDLNDQAGGFTNNQGVLARPVNLPWGGLRHVPEDAYGHRFGSIGPLGDDGVCFQRLHDLCCVDPLTGKPVWTRKNVGLGNDLFGDEELLFVAPPGDADTMVLAGLDRRVAGSAARGALRPADGDPGPPGAELGTAKRDADARRLGRSNAVVAHVRSRVEGRPGRTRSRRRVSAQRRVHADPLADGKVLVKEQLQAENSLLGIFLLRTAEGYLLIANVAARNEPNVSVQPIPAAPNSLISGQIYAFERGTGKKAVAGAAAGLATRIADEPTERSSRLDIGPAGSPPGPGEPARTQDLGAVHRQADRQRGVSERSAARFDRGQFRSAGRSGGEHRHDRPAVAVDHADVYRRGGRSAGRRGRARRKRVSIGC